MANFRLPVAPLNGGVSTQPYDNRQVNQTKTADNVILKLQRGLEKRPGSTHVAKLSWAHDAALNTNMFTHFFSYGDEDYVLLIDDDECDTTPANDLSTLVMTGKGLQIFNLSDGTKATLNVADATRWADVSAYLRATAGTASRDKLKAITYGNTTIVLNTKVPTAVEGTTSAIDAVRQASGSGTTVGADYYETTLQVPPLAGAHGSTGHSHAVNDWIHLLTSTVGYPAGYYKIIALGGTDINGPWYERGEAYSDNNTISPDLMPFQIKRTAENTFTIDTIDWNKRLSGDEDTNPAPYFIGETIKDVCIFQDRLWIGSETAIVASQAGDLFNFWVDDYTNATDADPISLTMPGPDSNQVQWLVPMDDRILVFGSQGTQHEITTRDIFSPSNTNLQTTTNYRSSGDPRPVVAGQQALFIDSTANSSSLWEYFYDFGSDSNLAIEASIQCQTYLPSGVFHFTNSHNDQMVFMAAKDSSDIYVYHYYWDVNQKLQSAFCRWRMYTDDTNCKIIGLHCLDGKLYVLHERLGSVFLEYLDLRVPNIDSPLDFGIALDSKVVISNGTYSASTNVSTFVLPDWEDTTLGDVDHYRIILTDNAFDNSEGGGADRRGMTVIPATVTTNAGTTILTVSGNWAEYDSDDDDVLDSNYSVTIGIVYEMSAELNQPIVTDENGQAVQGNFQIRTMEVRHQDTTSYEVLVTPNRRETKTFAYNAGRIGSAIIAELNRSTYGRFNVRVFGNSQDTQIVLSNSSPYPVLITKLEYIGDFVPQRTNPLK